MAAFISQTRTLIRSTASSAYLFRAANSMAVRRLSAIPESSSYAEMTASEVEAKVVDSIEDFIHNTIVYRSRPEWLPFVPGASYWIPPRRSSYGVAELVRLVANAPTEEEYLSLVTLQGWPSSAFYIHSGICPSILFRMRWYLILHNIYYFFFFYYYLSLIRMLEQFFAIYICVAAWEGSCILNHCYSRGPYLAVIAAYFHCRIDKSKLLILSYRYAF